MKKQSYPFFIEIYRGEQRILFNPLILHSDGYRVDSSDFVRVENTENYEDVGKGLLKAVDNIKNSFLSNEDLEEREFVWKLNSKYKNRIAFWRNNDYALFRIYEEGHCQICFTKRSEEPLDGCGACVKDVDIPANATAEEIGKVIVDSFKIVDEYNKGIGEIEDSGVFSDTRE